MHAELSGTSLCQCPPNRCHCLHTPVNAAQDSTHPDSFSPRCGLDESSTGQFQSINAGKRGRDEPTATGQFQGRPTDQVTGRKRRRISRGGREESTSEASLPAPYVGAGRLPTPQPSEDSLEDHMASQSVAPDLHTVENDGGNFPGNNVLDGLDQAGKVGQPALISESSGGGRTCLRCRSSHGLCIHSLIEAATMSASGSALPETSVRFQGGSPLLVTDLTGSRGDTERGTGTGPAEQGTGGPSIFFTDPSGLSPCPAETAASSQVLDIDLPSQGMWLKEWSENSIFELWPEPLGVFELQ
jgi:hypothetical protein